MDTKNMMDTLNYASSIWHPGKGVYDGFREIGFLLKACLGTLRDDEPLPPWVDWGKMPERVRYITMDDDGLCRGWLLEPIPLRLRWDKNLESYDYPDIISSDALIYLPHPSLWRRSKQERS